MEEVKALRRDVVEVLDPDRDMRPGESRVRHAFMESSPVQQAQLGHETIMELNRLLLGVPDGGDMTLHKSAAIVRQPGSPAVAWHSDFCGHFPLPPLNTGHVLLRSDRVPTGIWFYLSGSHPRRGGLCVIENSHRASWPGPEGFELFDNGAGKSFRRLDETPRSTSRYSRFDVPGCVPLITEPGDLILFAARTYQYKTNQKACAICTRAPLPFADSMHSFLLTRRWWLLAVPRSQLHPSMRSRGSLRVSCAAPPLSLGTGSSVHGSCLQWRGPSCKGSRGSFGVTREATPQLTSNGRQRSAGLGSEHCRLKESTARGRLEAFQPSGAMAICITITDVWWDN